MIRTWTEVNNGSISLFILCIITSHAENIDVTLDFALIYVLCCWWERSCTTWDVWNLENGINYTNLKWLAGLPSTVWTANFFFPSNFSFSSLAPLKTPPKSPFRKGQCQLWKELLDICPGPWFSGVCVKIHGFRTSTWKPFVLHKVSSNSNQNHGHLGTSSCFPGVFFWGFLVDSTRIFFCGWQKMLRFIYASMLQWLVSFFDMFKELIYEKRHNVSFSVFFSVGRMCVCVCDAFVCASALIGLIPGSRYD